MQCRTFHLSTREAFRRVACGREHALSAHGSGAHRGGMSPAVHNLALQPRPKPQGGQAHAILLHDVQ